MKKCIVLLICLLMLTGCASRAAETTEPTFAPVVTEPAPETTMPEIVAAEHYLTLYAPNEDATGFIYASVEIPEYGADAICNALIGAKVLKEDVKFNSLEVKDGQVDLDVNEAFLTQLFSYGTAGEYMMVGSVVNTLLSAFDAQTVFITVDGEIMESGHVIYDFPMEFFE